MKGQFLPSCQKFVAPPTWGYIFMKSKLLRIFLASLLITVVIPTSRANAACSISAHCYGEESTHVQVIDGILAKITPSCIGVPAGNFATDEIWLASQDFAYWVEVGYIMNFATINGLSQGLLGFWYDSRPGHTQAEHVMLTNPPLIERQAEIRKSATNTYLVALGGAANKTSTDNSMTPYWGNIGSEITSSAGVSYSNFSRMEYHENGSWSTELFAPTATVNAPQTQSWITLTSAMNAGVPC